MGTRAWGELSEYQRLALLERIEGGKQSVRSACDAYGVSPEQLAECARTYRPSALYAFGLKPPPGHGLLELPQDDLEELHSMQEVESTTTTGFIATLGNISMPDLVQTIASGGKSGVITVTHSGASSRIWLADGEVVDADSGRLNGEAAAYRILALQHGELVTDFYPLQRERTVNTPLPSLLLQGAFRQDKCAALYQQLTAEGAVYARNPDAPEGTVLGDAEAVVLDLIDGSRSVDEVMAQSMLGDLETLTAMMDLWDRGWLRRRRATPSQPQAHHGQAPVAFPDTESAVWPMRPPPRAFIMPRAAFSQQVTVRIRRRVARIRPMALLAIAGLGLGAWLLGSMGGLDAASDDANGHTADGLQPTQGSAPPSGATPGSAPLAATTGVAMAAPRPEDAALSYFVQEVHAHPPQAELWLDGEWVGTGNLTLRLLRDHVTHELRVAAAGYRTKVLHFSETRPFGPIVLSPIDALSVNAPRAGGIALAPASLPAQPAPQVEPETVERGLPGGGFVRRGRRHQPPREPSATPQTPLQPRMESVTTRTPSPKVEFIEPLEPRVDVLD